MESLVVACTCVNVSICTLGLKSAFILLKTTYGPGLWFRVKTLRVLCSSSFSFSLSPSPVASLLVRRVIVERGRLDEDNNNNNN